MSPNQSTESIHYPNPSSLYIEMQKSKNKQNHSEKNKAGRYMLPDFKTYEVAIIKTMWYWHKSRWTDQQNRVQKESHMDIVSWFVTKGIVQSHWKIKVVFINCCWVHWYSFIKKLSWLYFTPQTNNFWWTADVNAKGKMLKFLFRRKQRRTTSWPLTRQKFLNQDIKNSNHKGKILIS